MPCPLSTASNQRQIISVCVGGQLNHSHCGHRCFFERCFPKHAKSIIWRLKIASVRCWSLKCCRAVAKATHMCGSFSQLIHSETTCEHVAHGSIPCRWWHTIYMERVRTQPHGSPYICSPWLWLQEHIAVEHIENCWGHMTRWIDTWSVFSHICFNWPWNTTKWNEALTFGLI